MIALILIAAILSPIDLIAAKTYDRCELAQEMVQRLKVPMNQIADWICLIRWESEFNTSAVGSLNSDGSLDHGLFQISDKYWCYNGPGTGEACGLNCDQLRNNDIKDDWICARRIFRQHQRLTGNGFNAWVAWKNRCQSDTSSYIDGCFHEKDATGNRATLTNNTVEDDSVFDDDHSEDDSILLLIYHLFP